MWGIDTLMLIITLSGSLFEGRVTLTKDTEIGKETIGLRFKLIKKNGLGSLQASGHSGQALLSQLTGISGKLKEH